MHVLRIVGAGATTLYDRFTAQLDGRVAIVESLPKSTAEPESTDDVVVAYGLSPDGSWVGSDDDRDLDGPLGDFSIGYDYVLLLGFPDACAPAVVLAGVDVANIVAEAETVDAADVASLAAEIDSHEPHVTLETLVKRAKADPLEVYVGAIATFIRQVRAKESEDDDLTLSLKFEKYDGTAESKMDATSEELEARNGVLRASMHHRVDIAEDGTDIVFVIVFAEHCREALRTVEDGIDRLKDEVPIFKKETTTDEGFRAHDR